MPGGACSKAASPRRRRTNRSGDLVQRSARLHAASRIAADPEEIIPLLNEYADAIISAIHEHGGDVLKLMGDGVLAIFTAGRSEPRLQAALAAAEDAPRRVAEVNGRRTAERTADD